MAGRISEYRSFHSKQSTQEILAGTVFHTLTGILFICYDNLY